MITLMMAPLIIELIRKIMNISMTILIITSKVLMIFVAVILIKV